MEKASNLFENLYKCIRQTALSDPYKAADETYYKILVPEKNSREKDSARIPLGGCGHKHRMIYLLYDDGSQSELEKSKSIYEYGSYMFIMRLAALLLARHCQLSVSGKIPMSHVLFLLLVLAETAVAHATIPDGWWFPASGCRFRTSSSFF